MPSSWAHVGHDTNIANLSQIGAAAQYRTFGVFEKAGTSTWTLTSTTTATTPSMLIAGTLSVSADNNLGAAAGDGGLGYA